MATPNSNPGSPYGAGDKDMERDPEDEISPLDSVSLQGSGHTRASSTSSIKSQKARAITREIQLAARSAIMKKRHEIKMKTLELQCQQEELELNAQIEAAKAITYVWHEKDTQSNVSSNYDKIAESIIQRAKKIEQERESKTNDYERSMTSYSTVDETYEDDKDQETHHRKGRHDESSTNDKHETSQSVVHDALHPSQLLEFANFVTKHESHGMSSHVQENKLPISWLQGKLTKQYPGQCLASEAVNHGTQQYPGQCLASEAVNHGTQQYPGQYLPSEAVNHGTKQYPGQCLPSEAVNHGTKQYPGQCLACEAVNHGTQQYPGQCLASEAVNNGTQQYPGQCLASEAVNNGTQQFPGQGLESILTNLIKYQQESTLPPTEVDPFDGNALNYLTFISQFKMLVEDATSNSSRRLDLLLKFTKGEAHGLIRDCTLISPPSTAYEKAKELLYRDYGQPAIQAAAYKNEAHKWPRIQGGDKESLRKFSVFITNCCLAKASNLDMNVMDSYEFHKVVAGKLPVALQQQWINEVGKCRRQQRSPTLEDFQRFVGQLSQNENDPRIAGLGYQGKNQSKQKEATVKKRAFATKTSNGEKKPSTITTKENKATQKPCLYCGTETHHAISECRKFSALKPTERSDFCKKGGICYGCMNPGHIKKKCPNPEWAKCQKCSRKHPTALHDPTRDKKDTADQQQPKEIKTGCVNTRSKQSNMSPLMTIIPVLVKPKKGSKCVATYAFLDNGCGAVFAAEKLNKELHTRARRTQLLLKTLNSEEILETRVIQDQLQISDLDGNSFIDLPDVYLKDDIPVNEDDMPKQENLNKWKHLESVDLPDLESYHMPVIPRVTLMIGSNVPAATQPIETKTGNLGEPYAIRSPLGWLVYGLISHSTQQSVSVNFSRVSNITSIQTRDENLEQIFKDYVNREFEERLDGQTSLSREDKRFLKIMEETIVKEEDSHYRTALPFKDRSVEMPNNRFQAMAYAERLKKRMQKDSHLHQKYSEFMKELEDKKYSERIPETEKSRDDGRVWYIPHHNVVHPHKPEKVRVVFNCPVKYKGTSLNEELLQGPDLTNRLLGVLVRWRKEPVALMADIESMFYQVRIQPDDCDMVRYIWWPEGNLNQDPMEYRMRVHLFGAVSSPSCSNYALKRTALDNEDKYEKQVTDAVKNDFYVDDLLKSVSTEDEGIKLANDLRVLLQEGGFNLTKWISNSRKILQSIPEAARAKEVKTLDLDYDKLPVERALGVVWNVETDHLGFTSRQVNKNPTRRNILSVMGSIYDPLGMVAPYVLQARKILQTLCQKKISWDEEIPKEEYREWESWLQDLPKIEQVKIARCFKLATMSQPSEVQMHHFADASEAGYGTVTYLRFVNGTDVHCSFVSAKARVAPLKKVSIPRLELTTATVMVRIDNMLKRELHMDIHQTYYWTDSQTVLRYINNESSRFQTFVANRIEVIRDGSEPSQWRYVPSESNPADDCSRGLTMDKLINSRRWFQGPEFLWQEETDWPRCVINKHEPLTSEDPEVKKSALPSPQSVPSVEVGVVKAAVQEDSVNTLLSYFSNWMKLRRIVAWWLRLKKMLLMKSKKSKPCEGTKKLSLEEIQQAEVAVIKFVQHQTFSKEISALKNGTEVNSDSAKDGEEKSASNRTPSNRDKEKKRISKASAVWNLDPVYTNGLLRVGGRLGNASIPEAAQHPVILPKDHHVSDMIIRHVHSACNHQGKNHVLSEMRQKYWIVKASAAVKRILRSCVICKRVQGKVNTQKMADLPTCRVQAEEPPFTKTGIDYFGPFEIKIGRTMRKRYGVIFTCLASRAIHIEIAESLDTSSAINALRRFISRRGQVKELHSDNGTNFTSANKELCESLKALDQDVLHNFSTTRGIDWRFNPPAASHHGGAWERQVRTIRKILHAILAEQHLKTCQNEEQLRTLMCEIEATVNSRPLTRASDDPNDLNVITPNDLLLLRSTTPMPPGKFDDKDIYAKKRWRQVQYLADTFWKRWSKEYLPTLQARQKWLQPQRNMKVGDVVLVIDHTAPRNAWPMGIVEEVYPGNQELVRSVKVRTKSSVFHRPISKLCMLLEQDN